MAKHLTLGTYSVFCVPRAAYLIRKQLSIHCEPVYRRVGTVVEHTWSQWPSFVFVETGHEKIGVGATLRDRLTDCLKDTATVVKRRKRLWSMHESDWTQVVIARRNVAGSGQRRLRCGYDERTT